MSLFLYPKGGACVLENRGSATLSTNREEVLETLLLIEKLHISDEESLDKYIINDCHYNKQYQNKIKFIDIKMRMFAILGNYDLVAKLARKLLNNQEKYRGRLLTTKEKLFYKSLIYHIQYERDGNHYNFFVDNIIDNAILALDTKFDSFKFSSYCHICEKKGDNCIILEKEKIYNRLNGGQYEVENN